MKCNYMLFMYLDTQVSLCSILKVNSMPEILFPNESNYDKAPGTSLCIVSHNFLSFLSIITVKHLQGSLG